MNKVKTIKVKNEDGSISEESYSITADAVNVDMVNGKNVQETIGTIDVDKDGDIATQLNKKINKNDINNLEKESIIISGNVNTTFENATHIDTINKKIKFGNFAYLYNRDSFYNLSNKEIDFEEFEWYALIYFNTKTEEFIINNNAVEFFHQNNDESCVLIGALWNSGKYCYLNIYPYYYVDGVKISRYSEQNLSKRDKYVSFLGDSITTFQGVTETGYISNGYYPHGDVNDVSLTWWKIVQKKLGFCNNLGGISAISRTCYRNQNDDLMPAGYEDVRINKLSENHTPDFIFVNLGTNDCFAVDNNHWDGTIDINALNENNTRISNGCGLTLIKLQNKYPNAKIIVLIPKICIATGNFTPQNYKNVCEEIEQIAKSLGCYVIDLRKCGINYSNIHNYTFDNIHPNKKGMEMIADYIINEFSKLDY